MDARTRLASALDGRYTIERPIGAGGMGTVYRAIDTRHNRCVAIKVFQSDVSELVGSERFSREIQIAAQLDHPHILMLIDSGAMDGLLYYVMPFVEGESLRDRLNREPELPISEAIRIAAQVADALDYAHKRGVVHRDIKPENILLAHGHAKVADFGIARTMAADTRLTVTGMTVGTPAYMSPEQFLGESDVDGRSDCYSLGCVLFEMLAGTPPLRGPSAQATMVKRITQEAERVSTLRANVPPMVDLVLARALSNEAKDRHHSAGDFAAALLAEISGSSAATSVSTDGVVLPARRTPLIGREAELAQARRLLDELSQGRGGVMLVGGEPGVGKTRLCQVLLDEARGRGALCLVGRCYEQEGTPPFTPYAELLDVVSRLVPARTFRDVLGDAAPEIARVLPSLRQTFPDIPAPLDLPADQQRQHLHGKYREFNERAAKVSPIVVLLDDLHWADEATLALLEHQAGYLGMLPIVVLGTYRDVDLDVQRGFARTLEALTRQRLATRISVKRLPVERVADLLGALGGAPPPVELARVIHEETDGNPFFVEEVFAHLKEEGRLFDAAGRWRTDLRVVDLDVPEGVKLVIGRRLERLSETCRAVLTSAAVIGPRFELAVLERLGDGSEDEVLDALDAAVRARLLTEQRGTREPTYVFSHELIRQTLWGGLSLPRRQRRHLKVASALEDVLGARAAGRASDIAHHLYQAGTAADPNKTAHYLTLAAEQACTSSAYTEALAQVERAATIDDVSDKRVIARLTNARANALRGAGRWSDAIAALLMTVEQAIEAGDVERIVSSAMDATVLLGWVGGWEDSLKFAERALAAIPETHVVGRIGVLGQIALSWGCVHLDHEGGRSRFAEAERLAQSLGDPLVLAQLNLQRAYLDWGFAQMDSVVAFADIACAAFSEPRYRQPFLDGAAVRISGYMYGGHWKDVRSSRVELEHMGSAAGNHGATFLIEACRDLVELWGEGHLRAAGPAFRSAAAAAVQAGAWSRLLEGWASMDDLVRGDVSNALHLTDQAHRGFPYNTWSGAIAATEILAAAYHSDAAWNERVERLSKYVPRADRVATTGCAWYGIHLAMGHYVRGDRSALAALYPAIRKILEGGFRVAMLCPVESVAGIAAEAAGDLMLAERHLEEGMALVDRIGHRPAQSVARQWYAEMLMRRNAPADSTKARTLLDQATSEFRAMGMSLMLERVTGRPPLSLSEARPHSRDVTVASVAASGVVRD